MTRRLRRRISLVLAGLTASATFIAVIGEAAAGSTWR
jgi:hypothetical protein